MRRILGLFFGFVLVAMLVVTTWASSYENVFVGGGKLLREPWGVATLFDTYFAFLTFYIWVFYKETSWMARILWLLGVLILGNIAMAVYVLLELRNLPSKAQMPELLLRRKNV